MQYRQYKGQSKIPTRAVIKDEAGRMALVIGSYPSPKSGQVYIVTYKGGEMKESLASTSWSVGDKRVNQTQAMQMYAEAIDKAEADGSIKNFSPRALQALGVRWMIEPLTADGFKRIESGKTYIPDVQPTTVFGQAGYDFIKGETA